MGINYDTQRMRDTLCHFFRRVARNATRINRNKFMISHPARGRIPKVQWLMTPNIVPTKEDIQIADRLLASYNIVVEDEKAVDKKPEADHWTDLQAKIHADFLLLLKKGDPGELAGCLCNMSRHSVTHGINQGAVEYGRINSDKNYQRHLCLFTKDKLVSLAEATGALALENPEQGHFGENMLIGVDELVELIERVLGVTLAPPPIDGCLFKIKSNKGMFCYRDLTAAYTAWLINRLLADNQLKSICEIGGGTGRVAYYCNRLGMPDYTIIDLPHVNVIQGYYLLKTLPGQQVTLYGEGNAPPNTLKIFPYWSFRKLHDKSFTLIHNQDSFPEIDEQVVKAYLADIKNKTRCYFLTINHESMPPFRADGKKMLSVPRLVEEVGGYARVYRSRFWLRDGYAEELYRIA